MRQIHPFFTCCFVAAFLLIAAACSKTGPTGATGPAGPAGPTGAAGAAGAAGPAGTANVIYSTWLDAKYKADTQHNGTVIDTLGFYFDTTGITKLTSAILTSGEIKIYINLGTATSPAIIPLPYWDPYSQISINPTFFTGEIYIYSDYNVSTYLNAGVKQQQWRYILIPGGTTARSAVDWNNYAEVKKYLNLPD